MILFRRQQVYARPGSRVLELRRETGTERGPRGDPGSTSNTSKALGHEAPSIHT